MKYINEIALCAVAISIVAMVGCSPRDFPRDFPRDRMGRPVRDTMYPEVCINGVVYYRGNYGITPKFLPDSTVEACE